MHRKGEAMTTISERLREDDLLSTRTEAADTIDALVAALEESKEALDDWLHQYAPEHCGEKHVVETWRRISANGGTLAYIANTQERNRAALAKAKGKQE